MANIRWQCIRTCTWRNRLYRAGVDILEIPEGIIPTVGLSEQEIKERMARINKDMKESTDEKARVRFRRILRRLDEQLLDAGQSRHFLRLGAAVPVRVVDRTGVSPVEGIELPENETEAIKEAVAERRAAGKNEVKG